MLPPLPEEGQSAGQATVGGHAQPAQPASDGDRDDHDGAVPGPPAEATVRLGTRADGVAAGPADAVAAGTRTAGDGGSPEVDATEPAGSACRDATPRAVETGDPTRGGTPGDEPTRAAAPGDEPTRVAAADGPAADARPRPDTPGPLTAATPERDSAPTRVVAPRWTASAAVPPPRRRGRRWFDDDEDDEPDVPAPAAPGSAPAPPTPRRLDPTLRMPAVDPEEAEIPTPVDPWAGVAHDPWATPPHPHPDPVSPQPAAGYGTSTEPAPPMPAGTAGTAVPVAPSPRQPPAARRSSAPVAPPPPVAPPRTAGSRRKRPAPPPPDWKPPRDHVAIPVRRRRRWPWVMLTLTLLTVACCCGLPGYYLWPIWNQYPARPADPLPERVLDLRLQSGREDQQVAEDLKTSLRMRNWIAETTFAAVYRDGRGKRVTVFGTTGLRLDPQSDLEDEFGELAKQYDLRDVRDVDTGVRGEHRRCGVGRERGESVVVCTVADHGSLITGSFTFRNVDESAELLVTMREEIIQRD